MILDGRGSALNDGGMGMYAGAEFQVGEQIAVEFTPAYSSGPIRVEVKISNRNGYNYGLEFLTDTSARKEQADNLLSHLNSLTGTAEG